jgi:hypothetical protein
MYRTKIAIKLKMTCFLFHSIKHMHFICICFMILNHEDQFEDIKDVIRICKSKKDRQQRKGPKGQTTIYKTLLRKPKIEQHEQ